MAQKILDAINHQAWQQTGAVRWDFDGRQQHLWDKRRHLARVRWGDTEVLVNLSTQTGRAFRDGQEVSGEAAEILIRKAWAHWANDSFWLNPFSKIYDQGTERSLVETGGGTTGLLVSFGTGGVTPGDSYLLFPDAQGLPKAWQMWVSIIPVGGITATWEDWVQSSTGIWISRKHKIFGLTLELRDVTCADNLLELTEGVDPFESLIAPN